MSGQDLGDYSDHLSAVEKLFPLNPLSSSTAAGGVLTGEQLVWFIVSFNLEETFFFLMNTLSLSLMKTMLNAYWFNSYSYQLVNLK